MHRRPLAVGVAALLTAGLLTSCTRTEDRAYSEFPRLDPTPARVAPMVVPYPAREGGIVRGGDAGK